jgi:predicted enzyme related to lactoylglutathione lyase
VTEQKRFPHGTFCWADLGASDVEDAKRFYTMLFHWQASEMTSSTGATYTIMNKADLRVCAIYSQTKPSTPTVWQVYFAVDSADAFAKKAEAEGGRSVQAPVDVMDAGRAAVLADPTGASFVAWEARSLLGFGVRDEPDTVAWCEADTTDLEGTVSYYSRVFGWATKVDGEGPHRYVHFKNGDRMVGGAMQVQKEWGPVPSHWAVCFAVTDVDITVQKARKAGGRAVVAPTTIPGTGRFAVLADPQGATFQVFRRDRG